MTAINEDLEAISDLQSLIDVADEAPVAAQTGVARKAEIAEAIDKGNLQELVDLQATLSNLLDRILSNTVPEPGLLTDEQLYGFALEHLDRKDLERLLEVRHKVVKAAIFAHITETNRIKGLADPQHQPGEALIPGMGRKFAREGGKMKATLDKDKLKDKLGDKWEQVCKAEIVPAVPEHIEYHLDEDALLAMVKKDPALLDVFRDCIIPGGYGVARLVLKEIKK